jgi:hypothetical protein
MIVQGFYYDVFYVFYAFSKGPQFWIMNPPHMERIEHMVICVFVTVNTCNSCPNGMVTDIQFGPWSPITSELPCQSRPLALVPLSTHLSVTSD